MKGISLKGGLKLTKVRDVEELSEPPLARVLFRSRVLSPIWLVIRLYVGYVFLAAGIEKAFDPKGLWIGSNAGKALYGFLMGALKLTEGPHPAVQGWYKDFLVTFVLPHVTAWSYLVTFGEILVGVGLILGAFTGIAAFFGVLMNASYLFAGTVSVNPQLLLLGVFLILAWRVAGWWGLDRVLLPILGVPWEQRKS